MTSWIELSARYGKAHFGVLSVMTKDTCMAGRIEDIHVGVEVHIRFVADGKTVLMRIDPSQSLAERTTNCFHSSRGVGGGIYGIGCFCIVLVTSIPFDKPLPQLARGWSYLLDEQQEDDHTPPKTQKIRLND